ncbi:uncharacterized protein [Oryza sativa Japonica Group]|uniref:Os02g0637900 protein n=3 Tax=Oryza sativa subsp. japonica TaxID=39947 RepID=Q6H5V7_ORYSJ|nr:uncharacterized protein LOC4330092 isoform X1 [Oryza sativa Japonica Group]KAB8088110.1 hypothetical protein EE612_012603 [Oryza sativa]KAF2946036.1 hypothetical protein DAI22_02g261800 [Oryza sativa Japonica Group]BAD25892.1 unknown protein [Oryza sativa Japonica Group]BAF09444.1 Os02g0637900 [Oryza sativa Japonica Group]BAG99026.1 unnamed protein product [Oryza sativa Japonica Group]|eukprot:NP_001047530.1 Os02g0637900 [Oryza sativa Japonica Group]
MSGREVREYTNLSDPKDRKWGKGKDKIDDEDITFQRMVAKMQEVAGERGGYLHGRGALDSDDLLYLKEQMEAEEDAERLLRRTEKRAFAAFKKAAILADSTPAVPAALRVEPKPKSDIRQQDLLKNIVGIKPKRTKVSSPSQPAENDKPKQSPEDSVNKVSSPQSQSGSRKESSQRDGAVSFEKPLLKPVEPRESKPQNATGSLLGLAYESSDEE